MVGCSEYGIAISRRVLLRASVVLSFAALPDLSFGAEPSNGRLLVILLRGGMDGLAAMPPVGDPGLVGKRKHLIPDNLLKLDGFFALHPSLQAVHQAYVDGNALLVHGISTAYTGRSHFEGQDIMESGMAQPYSSATGWLGRALDASGFAALSMSLPVPLILRGKTPVENRYPTWIANPPKSIYEKLNTLWAGDADFAEYGAQLVKRSSSVADLDLPAKMGQDVDLSDLAITAALKMRDPDGPRVGVLDYVGFDTHASQPGEYSDKLSAVDNAIKAFRGGMGEVWKNTLVVTVTEFGRTVAENGSSGTDHGWGSSIFVVGGALKKSGIVADWPGLKPANLFERRDLKATLNARALYGAVVSRALGIDPDLVRRNVISSESTTVFDGFL